MAQLKNLPIRVLHVVSCMDRAGQETFIMNFYRNINRKKIQFDFLCSLTKKADFDDEIKKLGGKIHYLPPSNIKVPHLYNIGVILSYRNFFLSHPEYQITHFHNYQAFSVLIQIMGAKLGNVERIIVHSHNTNAPHPFIHKITKPILNLFNIHRFACSTDAGFWMFGSKSANFKVVKNGIDSKSFCFNLSDRNRIRQEFNIFNKKVILHIGRFNYQKNHRFLIDIFEKILKLQPESHLLLVGRGELEDKIKEIVKEKGLQTNITFAGIRADVPALFSASDLFLFPSLFEGLSVVLVEAQASGINVLTTTNLAEETIFSETVSQLSINDTAEAWANKALELMSQYKHQDMRDKVLQAGFDMEGISLELSDFYLDIN